MTITANDSVTARVRVLMAVHRHKQSDLGSALGLTQAAVSAKLTGRAGWTLKDLDRLSSYYGLDVAQIVTPPAELVDLEERRALREQTAPQSATHEYQTRPAA